MTAQLLDGNALAETVYAEIEAAVQARVAGGGTRPHLATLLVGDDPASAIYVRMKQRNCLRAGISTSDHRLPATATTAEVIELISRLDADPEVSAILPQMPMPPQVDAEAVIEAISPAKDVDGLHPYNAGRLALGAPVVKPCTPAGIIELLRANEVPVAGRRAVVVGRSNLVGKPVALLLLQEQATVTICHSRTVDLREACRQADVLVSAVGKAFYIQADWVKPGAAVVDVGVSRLDGRVVGDVDPGVEQVAGWLTPNPGGVGPMTRAMLVRNTYDAEARRR
ncbi:MAG TPA: bifunctional 5,10-methylenetetrahydrofolate dehydrogenase/5,10-methenyltetrahydrofolate cyclohydrolase [Candidatus Dormibacteraeota bacterium]|nr:bifunctional 5,10-methylenetetrahydrofolate dehydrogenase/5,10-methenyltetrahydrofolate cyclohydrolase [Candidatus Dormibacteraeota bacterium]